MWVQLVNKTEGTTGKGINRRCVTGQELLIFWLNCSQGSTVEQWKSKHFYATSLANTINIYVNKLEITTRGLSVIFNLWSLEAQCTCVSKNRWRYHSLPGYARRSSAGCQSGVASEVLFQASCLWGSWKTFLDSPRLHCTQPGETGMIFFNSSVLLCVVFFTFVLILDNFCVCYIRSLRNLLVYIDVSLISARCSRYVPYEKGKVRTS